MIKFWPVRYSSKNSNVVAEQVAVDHLSILDVFHHHRVQIALVM